MVGTWSDGLKAEAVIEEMLKFDKPPYSADRLADAVAVHLHHNDNLLTAGRKKEIIKAAIDKIADQEFERAQPNA